jgi:pseudouridine-5'-phosphate glycosidase
VKEALQQGEPVVALESTIIAHGMPYPANIETARMVEQIISDAGAVPATLGMVAGEVVVGLSSEQLQLFATSNEVLKAGERDLPLAAAKKAHAATTAGASIAIAGAAGIRVFVTGGIGGVGPLAAQDFDVSADLLALSDYPVITVCAGTKAFMDVAATLEYLETLRVPVATWRNDQFPLFYSRHSGCRSEWIVQNAEEVASAFVAQEALGIKRGLLLGVPVPEFASLPEAETRKAIDSALARLKASGVTGKAVTPFLLTAIKELTEGRSLKANIALIQNNARIGAEVAKQLSAVGTLH